MGANWLSCRRSLRHKFSAETLLGIVTDSIGQDPLVKRFMTGARHMNWVSKPLICDFTVRFVCEPEHVVSASF